jgi:hypothetical protein
MFREVKIFSIIVAVIVTGYSTAIAQTTPVFSDEIVLYRGERFMPFIDGALEEYTIPSADFTRQQLRMVGTMRDKISEASSILKACQIFHPPQGFKLVIHSQALPPVDFHSNESLSGTLRIELFVTMVCNEKPCYDKKTDATVSITFNDPTRLVSTHIMDDIWLQPRRISDFFGRPVYRLLNDRREITVVSGHEIPLYLPVTREDFIMTLIRHFGEMIAEDEYLAAQPQSKEIELSFSDAENGKRKDNFEIAYNSMFRFDPLLARKLKENFIQVERKLEEAKSDSTIIITESQYINMQLNVWREGIRKLRAELNAMSPSERRSQAHWSESETMNTSGLTPPGHPGSNPVARINPQIIDNSKPETDIQLITIEWGIDTAPYASFKQGRSLQYHRLYEFGQCREEWENLFSLVKSKE